MNIEGRHGQEPARYRHLVAESVHEEVLGGTICYVLCVGANHAIGGDTTIELGAGLGAPIKGGAGSTGVMRPMFKIPFTKGDVKKGGSQ